MDGDEFTSFLIPVHNLRFGQKALLGNLNITFEFYVNPTHSNILLEADCFTSVHTF